MAVQIAYEHENEGGYEGEYEGDVTAAQAPGTSQASGWGAVFALTLCVATLIASEFMPVSLLTPIAADLHMTEGGAGQAIALGATAGGVVYDASGYRSTFALGAAALCASALLAGTGRPSEATAADRR